MSKVCIGIDLGGTFIKLAAMDEHKKTFGIMQVPTPQNGAESVAGGMVEGAKLLMSRNNISPSNVLGVGIGSPGPLNREKGIVVASPNIEGFRNYPLRDRVQAGLGLPADLENDANAAAFGEFLCGAGQEVRSLVLLTLGTGVGGGIVIDGKVWHGSHDFGAEIGHMIVQPGGVLCGCGQHGCLEQYASATFLAKRAAEAIKKGRTSSLAGVLASNGSLDAVDVNTARKAGDALAGEIWDQAVYHLAVACVSLERILDCEMIVVAGGLTKAGDDLMTPLQKYYAELDWKLTPQMSRLAIARLGNDAGVIGAAGVAWDTFGSQK